MPRKCPHCKADLIIKPISKLPLWEGESFKSKFNWEALKWKNLNIKNLIMGDWINLMIIWTVLFVAWAYLHDTEVCREIYENPCDYVLNNTDTCSKLKEQDKTTYIYPGLLIQEINLSEWENDQKNLVN